MYTQIRKDHEDSVASTWTQDGRIHVLLKSKERVVLHSLSDCKTLPFKIRRYADDGTQAEGGGE